MTSSPALALLHQVCDDVGDEHFLDPNAFLERVVLGVLNPHRAEVEAVECDLSMYCDWAESLVDVHVAWETNTVIPAENGQAPSRPMTPSTNGSPDPDSTAALYVAGP